MSDRMLDRILETERYLLRDACHVEDHGTYRVWSAPDRPDWYQANHLQIVDAGGRSIDAWESIFRTHFDPRVTRHLMLHLPRRAGFEALLDEARRGSADQARESGDEAEGPPPLLIEETMWMLVRDAARAADLPPHLDVHRVKSEQDRESLMDFTVAEAREAPWYTNDDDVRGFFLSRLDVTERLGCAWFVLRARGSSEILARLGMFECGGMSRLQSVGTGAAHRRRGLGTILLGAAIRESISRGSEGLCLATLAGSAAVPFYERSGFAAVGEDFWIVRYPR